MNSISVDKTRIDKWLWAARFFKTRSIAKQAIDGGKVRVNGHRVKAGKDIEIGMRLLIRQGWEEKEVEVIALSEQRKGATEAQRLYRETAASAERRKLHAEQRRTLGPMTAGNTGRPNTKQRRDLQRIKREILDP